MQSKNILVYVNSASSRRHSPKQIQNIFTVMLYIQNEWDFIWSFAG
jgi:hypothetical protein